MVQAKMNESVQYSILALLVILVVGGLFIALQPSEVQETPDFPVDELVSRLSNEIALVQNATFVVDNDKIDAIYNEMREIKHLNEEDIVEDLAMNELDSKDFKRELADLINADALINGDLESYKDILDIVIKDIDVDLGRRDTAEVDLELKVYFFVDGDEDEEEKARVTVTLVIEDLDEDDDYEDAEVTDYVDLVLEKIYD